MDMRDLPFVASGPSVVFPFYGVDRSLKPDQSVLSYQGPTVRVLHWMSAGMPTPGSRLSLLAHADLRTGRQQGWFEVWRYIASVLNAKYEASRAAHAVSHDLPKHRSATG